MTNEYRISDDSDSINGHVIAGKSYKELDDDLSDHLDAYELAMVIIEEADDSEVEDMFLRLQNGMPLNAAEKRNAISGKMRDFIQETAAAHKLMINSVPFQNTRYDHDQVVAQMMCIEMNGGPTSVRHTKLKTMYENNKTFQKKSSTATSLKKVMTFLARAFPKQSPELTKVNLLSLYTVASGVLTKYALSDRATEFGNWFIGFENRRKEEETKPEDERDERMVSYQLAVLQQTANLASQEGRQRILTEDMLANMSDLILLDDQRLFTHDQKAAIFRKAGGKCVNASGNPDCVSDCQWNNFHADHIVPFAKGGRTTVENGQLLCPSCNHKKSDKIT